MDDELIEYCWKTILEDIGENPDREGLKDTPKRIAKMYSELFRGYDLSKKPKITVFDNGTDGITYDQMISDSGKFYSMCEHHAIPFIGEYFFAYIPAKKGKILGLSKVARIVDYHSAKLQIQERLVTEIVDELWKALCNNKLFNRPLGMGLFMRATHLCKSMRGAKKEGVMTTCCLKGCFKDDDVKQEFMRLIK